MIDWLRTSLVWRTILFANIASVTVVLAALGLALRGAEHRFEALHDITLWDQIDHIRRATNVEGTHVEIQLEPRLAAAYARNDGSMRFAVVTPAGEVRAASPGLSRALIDPAAPRATTPYFAYDDPETGHAGHGAQTRLPGTTPLFLQVGQGPQHPDVIADSLMEELLEHFALAALLGLVVQIIVTTLTIRSTLHPLQRIAEVTGAGELGPTRRLPVDQAPRELRPVVGTINALLAELEDHIARQRRFTADAAHQLRSPLARLEARLTAAATPEIAAQLRAPIDEIRALVTGLLDAARAEAMPARPAAPVDLAAIARHVGAALAPGAIARGLSLALTADAPSQVDGDEMWIAQAVSNVVTNAIHHAPRGTAIEIDITGDGTIAVRDYGPGIAEHDRAHVFDRFWRGRDEREPGAGLGLSIVASVMQAHGGTITVEDPPGGGALFRLRFPATAARST